MDPRVSDEDIRRDIPSFIEPRPPLINNPFMRPRPEKGINLLEKFEEDSEIIDDEPELVQVYLRMKPCKVPSNLYDLRSDKCLVTSLDTTTAGHGRRTQHNVSKMYTFSHIFKAESSQKEVFEEVVKGNLKRLVDGHSFTLLTYGASGSGKTYTLMGTVNSPGLVPRSLEYLFKLVEAAQTPKLKPSENGIDELGYSQQDLELQLVKRLLHISAPFRDKYRRMSAQLHSDITVSSVDLTDSRKHYVWVSFVEIYNEAIYDLLAPPERRAKLRLREDSTGNVYVKGVTQTFVRSGEEAYDVLVAGKHNLVVAATGIHAHSSRSHCIFTITMLTEKDGETHTSQVRLCDLAGCERQRAARNTGLRMQESRAINSSLHVLERCLHMLRKKQHTKEIAMVPYRECKLTRLLGSGLSGARGEAVTMVVTVNPAPQYAHETRHVLSLAAVAKDIQINNTMMDPSATTLSSLETTQNSTMQDYADEIMRLRTENERLHFELVQAQSCIVKLRTTIDEKRLADAKGKEEIAAETRAMVSKFYEKQIARLRNEINEMEEEFENKLDEAVKKEVKEMEENFEKEKMKIKEHYEGKLKLAIMSQKAIKMEDNFEGRLAEAIEKERMEMEEYYERKMALISQEGHRPDIPVTRKSSVKVISQPPSESIDERDEEQCEANESDFEDAHSDNESDVDLDESLEPAKSIRKSILNNEVTEMLNESRKLEQCKESNEIISHEHIDNADENLDESMDPVKLLRKSIIPKEISEKKNVFIDLIDESSEEESDNEEAPKEISNKVVSSSKDLLLSDDDSAIDSQSGHLDNEIDSTANEFQSVCKINDDDMPAKVQLTDTSMNFSVERDRSENEEMFNVSTKLDETKEKDVSNLRGTYFVRNESQSIDERVISEKERSNVSTETHKTGENDGMPANLRGTYYVNNEPHNECNVDKTKNSNTVRGTYFVNNEPHKECNGDKTKTLNTVRGTYFVTDREISVPQVDIDVEETDTAMKNNDVALENKESSAKLEESATDKVKALKKADTLVNKLLKSFKNRQSSESSLKQFEQLELAVNDSENSTHAVKNFEVDMPTQILKRKKYFDDSNELSNITETDKHNGKSNNDAKSIENLEDRTDFSQISSAAKKQEQRLFFDSPEMLSNSPDKQAKPKVLETGESVESIILTPKIITKTASNKGLESIEKQPKFFGGKMDECVQVTVAASAQEKRSLVDSPEISSTIPKDESKALENNNAVSLILTPKVKEAHLYYTDSDKIIEKDILLSKSPSIVKDDIPQEYEPSVAIKKILGESFKKPDIISSVRKERLATKHDSVDIFESPVSSTRKTNHTEKGIEMVSQKDVEDQEFVSVLKYKEKSSKIAQEFIEELVSGQKIKSSIEQKELQVANNHDRQKPVDKFHNKYDTKEIKSEITTLATTTFTEQPTDSISMQNDTKEMKTEILTICKTTFTEPSSTVDNTMKSDLNSLVDELKQSQLNDTQTSKGNNTIDEFENIVKNLSNVRATEFELLVSEENNTVSTINEPKRELNIAVVSKQADKKEITEHTKNFEEVKYNLRNKGKSILHSDDSIETEKAESKIKSTKKRCLRLRRRRNEDNADQDVDKLKDIKNLEKEFCDVTMGLPATEKQVKDIPSPEIMPGEEENVPPLLGVQSCPSKSVTRSRRKLFTPRAEALEESPCHGNSNERVNVPRPAYHGTRARRRL